MALIENSNPKEDIEISGYYRLLGCDLASELVRKTHSTVISSGSELEHLIKKQKKYEVKEPQYITIKKNGEPRKKPLKIPNTTPTFKDVEYACDNGLSCYFPKISITKEELKSRGIDYKRAKAIEVDGLWVINGKIIISEYKDGHAFDTKKTDGEINSLKKLELFFKEYDVTAYMVLWNIGDTKDASVKSIEAPDYLITGSDFCKKVDISFEEVNADRLADRKPNMEYFITQAKEILELNGFEVTKIN